MDENWNICLHWLLFNHPGVRWNVCDIKIYLYIIKLDYPKQHEPSTVNSKVSENHNVFNTNLVLLNRRFFGCFTDPFLIRSTVNHEWRLCAIECFNFERMGKRSTVKTTNTFVLSGVHTNAMQNI